MFSRQYIVTCLLSFGAAITAYARRAKKRTIHGQRLGEAISIEAMHSITMQGDAKHLGKAKHSKASQSNALPNEAKQFKAQKRGA